MIIKPKVRANICMNAHPEGCARETLRQIEYCKAQKKKRGIKSVAEGGNGPKFVLVLGCSTGYGLATRIASAFEFGADTIGVSFEREPSAQNTATPGWYNNRTFDEQSAAGGLTFKTFSADVYSHQTRKMVIDEAKRLGRKFDLVVYSIASAYRTDPDTGEVYQSSVKTQKTYYSGWGINILQDCLVDGESSIATPEDIKNSVKVMGGEDWSLWINQLMEADVLAEGCQTMAYSYIGPEKSYPIYRDGTIGHAKKHLEETGRTLNQLMKMRLNGAAFVSVNKGVVTRSSAVIPVISLYLSVLFKVMKSRGIHEDCIQQMERLLAEKLYAGKNNSLINNPADSENRIRMDDYELLPEVQTEVTKLMESINEDNFHELADVAGYVHDFYAVNGFDISGVDYDSDVDISK